METSHVSARNIFQDGRADTWEETLTYRVAIARGYKLVYLLAVVIKAFYLDLADRSRCTILASRGTMRYLRG